MMHASCCMPVVEQHPARQGKHSFEHQIMRHYVPTAVRACPPSLAEMAACLDFRLSTRFSFAFTLRLCTAHPLAQSQSHKDHSQARVHTRAHTESAQNMSLRQNRGTYTAHITPYGSHGLV